MTDICDLLSVRVSELFSLEVHDHFDMDLRPALIGNTGNRLIHFFERKKE